MVSALVAIEHGIKGHVSAPGCTSAGSALALGEAYRLIKHGYMDRVLVGGLDFNCDQNVIPGMDAFGALCTTFNDSPAEACRPFDLRRAGTVLSDGGGMIMLESLESAIQRNAKKIYAEIAGYGMTCDAYHALKQTESGEGLIKAVQSALFEAGLSPFQIDAFNCHATST